MRCRNTIWLVGLSLFLFVGCDDDPSSRNGSSDNGDDTRIEDAGGDQATDSGDTTQTDSTPSDANSDPFVFPDSTTDNGSTDIGGAFETCVPNVAGEVCNNGFDDDCDGSVDERCGCNPEGATQECYLGASSELGHPDSACRTGTQSCDLEFWTECDGAVGPSEEVCDDLIDNDCDGTVDEGCEVAPPEAICPANFEGPVLREYTLTASYNDPEGLSIIDAHWGQVSSPPGHSRNITLNGADVTFFADVAGAYVFEFYVENEEHRSATCQTVFTATTADVLRIEMYWNPDYVEDETHTDPSDIDLMLHRTATGNYDYYLNSDNCYWNNCATCDEPYDDDTAREVNCRAFLAGEPPAGWTEGDPWPEPVLDWAPGGNETDPRLDLDDVQGKGPENINILTPNAGTYRVGVHYYDDEGFGNSIAYVRILCAGEEYRSEGVQLAVHGLSSDVGANDFWEVGDITITYSGETPSCSFNEFGCSSCHRICSLDDAENGGCSPETCESSCR